MTLLRRAAGPALLAGGVAGPVLWGAAWRLWQEDAGEDLLLAYGVLTAIFSVACLRRWVAHSRRVAQGQIVGAMAASPVGVALFDGSGHLVESNAAYERSRAGGLVPRAGGPAEQHLRDGRWIRVEDHSTPSGGTISIVTEISEIKAREAELERRAADMDGLLANLAQGVCLFDPHNRVLTANARYAELLDLPPGFAAGGTRLHDILRHRAARGDYGAGEIDAVVAERMAFLNGNTQPIYEMAVPPDRIVEFANTLLPGGNRLLTLTDVTARRREEEVLRQAKEQAEAMSRTKSDLLANMSHELRTPLNAVIGFSEIMKDEMFGPLGHTSYKDYARDIFESGRHLLNLINDILDVSKAEAGKIELLEEMIDVAPIVEGCGRLVKARADAGGVHLDLRITAGQPRLLADERRLKQVLLNLLSNAVKFTPPDGHVTVTTEARGDGSFAFVVRDTGIGIAPEDLPKVLEPFGQVDSGLNRRYEGTGLGLTLTKALLELHGGRLEIDSVKGVGTAAMAVLPGGRVRAPDAVLASPPRRRFGQPQVAASA